jgi:hypothetical protein
MAAIKAPNPAAPARTVDDPKICLVKGAYAII